jgi:diguanylate cyclase (GGDEF)-like protein/PAS domain S-box-containing protein
MAATLTSRNDAKTELARLNRELRMLSDCNRALVRATREDELLNEVCRLAVEVGGYPCAWVGYVTHDPRHPIRPAAAVGIEIAVLEAIGLSWAEVSQGPGPSVRAIRDGTTQITHDVHADPAMKPYIAHADANGFTSVIALPLFVDGACVGVLDIYSGRVNAFNEAEAALLRELADDLAYGIGALRTGLEHTTAQQSLVRFRRLLDHTSDFIYVLDAQTGRLLDVNEALARKLGYTRTELLQMTVGEFSLAAAERPWPEAAELVRKAGSAFLEGSYRARDGTLCPVEIALTYVEEDHHPYIIVVSRDIGERRHEREKITRLTRALRMQSSIALAVLRISDRDELLQEACRIAIDLGGYDVATVSIVDPDGKYVRPLYRAGRPKRSASPPIFEISDGTTPDTSLTGLALRTGKLAVCNDLTQTELPIAARDALYQDGVRSMVALPLVVDGSKVGVLTMTSPNTGQIVDEELRLLEDIMATLSFALRSQQQADAVRYLAYFDSVTGLAKRSLFCDRLESLLDNQFAPETAPAVVTFCVDRLGSINDQFGGNFGDRLLKDVAERLRRFVESDDNIGYLGGGTFVMAEPGFTGPDESVTAALEGTLMGNPFSVDGRVIRVTASAGVARYGRDGKDADALVRSAEVALTRARDAGTRYRPEVIVAHGEISDRIALEHKLRRAIDARQFELRYLPQIDLATRRVVSVEALLRWNDPEQGVVAPQQFLPLLESSGLINPVGHWVLQRAIEDSIRWQALGLGPVRIAVNVSAQQMRRRAFAEYCHDLLERWRVRVPGYGIDLELTESVFLQDVEGTTRKLSELRSAGIRVALDDFGIGYSSLGMLSKLPVDLIKIDRSLIGGLPHDPASRALVASIMGLASAFSLITVAEGVEKPEQLELLEELECQQWQGYLFAMPLTVVELEELLHKVPAPLDQTGTTRTIS